MKRLLTFHWLLCTCMLAEVALAAVGSPVLAASGPQTFVYNGHLLDASGNAIQTAHTVRFSLWTSADYVTGDVTATGAILTSAVTYAGWKEAFTVTPDARGYFSVQLGSDVTLPDFSAFSAADLASLHLQVEVKAESDAATAYEVLDQDGSNEAVDRAPLLAVPFALNADLLDQRHAGTGSGSIPVLSSGGLLDLSQAPGGTELNTFTIDADNSVSSGNISLEFGDALGKTLIYDVTNGRFDFNDDLQVQGNLTVTGLINGIDITQIASSTDNSHLKVSSGAALTVTVARGDYRLGGKVTQYAGANDVAVTDDATNYIFFSSGGLTVRTDAFPTQSAVIPLASVITSGGAVQTITDRRVFNSNDTQRTIVKVYEPLYEGAAYEGDGTNNVGQLKVSHSGSVLRNYYDWSSTRSTLQDYDALLRVPVSSDFTRWGSVPLTLIYRTTSADANVTALAISVYDTTGAAVTLTGSGASGLASADWVTATWGFAGSPTWTPGGEMLIKLSFAAKDSASVQVGPLSVRFAEILSE
ncbi:MAG: hypothetical protein PHO20_01490 [Candidatus Peribacteraceae bacterium]|nr:hypothetical protein [Candidatus Peribacteraceae bacterium]MDD5739422.1 hypothetical protein [Candidatus Peribacteraceae bacterium]